MDFFLQILHQLHLFSYPLLPELFPLPELEIPVGQLSLQFLDVLCLSVADSKIILLLFLQKRAFPFGPQLVHSIVSQFFSKVHDGQGSFVGIVSPQLQL